MKHVPAYIRERHEGSQWGELFGVLALEMYQRMFALACAVAVAMAIFASAAEVAK